MFTTAQRSQRVLRGKRPAARQTPVESYDRDSSTQCSGKLWEAKLKRLARSLSQTAKAKSFWPLWRPHLIPAFFSFQAIGCKIPGLTRTSQAAKNHCCEVIQFKRSLRPLLKCLTTKWRKF